MGSIHYFLVMLCTLLYFLFDAINCYHYPTHCKFQDGMINDTKIAEVVQKSSKVVNNVSRKMNLYLRGCNYFVEESQK